MQRFVLIDGNAILHRAFHALPPLTSKSGEVVNAVYGFFSMFLKILEDQKPKYVVVCFDKAAPTFRQELYVGYQAQRPKISDDLIPQIKFVHDVLKKAKICIFEVDGYEADDLIGTISVQAVEGKLNRGIEVVIVSGDRDLLQLVNSHVMMMAPITGLTNMIVYDGAKVEEKFGVKPAQIVDYKALAGDSSDNYSGVPGVGPKTASDLLREYESLENIYKNLDIIKKKNEKLANRLAEGVESAGLAQKLAGIVTDAPIKLKLDESMCSSIDIEGLKEEFGRFGFKSLIKRLNSDGPKGTKETKETKEGKEKKEKAEQMGLL
jgi:DNA polymerase I